MRRLRCLLPLALAASLHAQGEESYPELPDSKQQDGVPAGVLIKGQFAGSEVFPGTVRDYWVYVPKQYDGNKPANVMGERGPGWRLQALPDRRVPADTT